MDDKRLAKEMHDAAMFACTSPVGHLFDDCTRSTIWWLERAARAIEAGETVGGIANATPVELAAAMHDVGVVPCLGCDHTAAEKGVAMWRDRRCRYRVDEYGIKKAQVLIAAAGRCE